MEFKKINKITIDAEMTNGLNGTFELDFESAHYIPTEQARLDFVNEHGEKEMTLRFSYDSLIVRADYH